MEENTDIIKTIENARPTLSETARFSLWNNIESKLPSTIVTQPIPSPFTKIFLLKNTYFMTSLALLLILALGGGATAFASDSARPGDALFPVERAIENLQLRLAFSQESRAALIQKLTDERLAELRAIIDEEITVSPTNTDNSASSTATSTSDILEIEATVFTDTTVVRIQIDGKQFYFETTATTSVDTLIAIQERFPMLSDTIINGTLDFATENRASRPKDRGVVSLSNKGQERVDKAVEALLSFLDSVETKNLNQTELLALISDEIKSDNQGRRVKQERDVVHIGNNNSRVEIRMDDDGDSKVEIRGNRNGQIRVEKSGDTIKVESDQFEDDDNNTERPVSDSNSLKDFSAKAHIFTDVTIVKLTFKKDSVYLETTATEREAIITAILNDFPALTRTQVDDQLRIIIDNRMSQPEDSGLTNPTPTTVTTPIKPQRNNGERDDQNEDDHDKGDEREGNDD